MNTMHHPFASTALRLADVGTRRLAREPLLLRLLDTLMTWQERARERRQMTWLSERELRDIGLSQAEMARELAKPFWRE
jgi:uncharacterized protein YjiS (DUF1127 family)